MFVTPSLLSCITWYARVYENRGLRATGENPRLVAAPPFERLAYRAFRTPSSCTRHSFPVRQARKRSESVKTSSLLPCGASRGRRVPAVERGDVSDPHQLWVELPAWANHFVEVRVSLLVLWRRVIDGQSRKPCLWWDDKLIWLWHLFPIPHGLKLNAGLKMMWNLANQVQALTLKPELFYLYIIYKGPFALRWM